MLDQCQKYEMKIRNLIGCLLSLVLITGSLHAHFIWAVIERSDDGDPLAQFFFSETASPDSAEFLDRLTRMQAWHRTAQGEYTPLQLRKVERDDGGLLAGVLTSNRGNIEAVPEAGWFEEERYAEARHYSAVTFDTPTSVPDDSGASPAAGTASSPRLTDLPRGITSFGAAVIGDWMYVYGGHFGRAHHYSNTSQSNQLSRLNLREPGEWEVVAHGPRLQGMAMVSHNGKIYRAGGFTAHNDEGDEHDLRSIADVVRFDPETGQWESLPDLPEPRSSHDAVVIQDHIYVVGGWQLGEERVWHETAWMADLSKDKVAWTPLPNPPFKRRALSLGHLDGKLYVIGGMQPKGGPTTRVDVFDPATGKWSQGPSMIDTLADATRGKGMEGFGASAYTLGGRLIVSTYNGNVQVLEPGDGEWKIAVQLKDDRFFHRMLPYESRLLLVGGASMRSGKRLHFEAVELSSLK